MPDHSVAHAGASPSGGTPMRGSSRPAPNYAARRMIVTTVAITAIVAFAVVGWKVVSGSEDGNDGPAATWSQLALIDRGTGAATIVDADGEIGDTIIGRGRATEVHTIGEQVALVGATQIVLYDLSGDGSEVAITVPLDRRDTVTPIRTADGLHLVVGKPQGGNVLVVDVAAREPLDVGAIAGQTSPLLFADTLRIADDGGAFAVADAANFQTILIDPATSLATFFPDQPIAIGAERVATSQVVGQQADIGLFDRNRKSLAFVPTPIPAGGVMVGNELVMVTIDGGVYRVTGDTSEAERLGAIAVPSGATVFSVHPTFDGERLVVAGAVFQAVIDLEGRTLFTTTFTEPVELDAPQPDWRCLPVGGDGAFHSIVSLDTGEQLAVLSDLEVIGVARDGCTVLGERDSVGVLVGTDLDVSIGRLRTAALGPDGRSFIRTDTSGRTALVRLDDDDELTEPIDLGDAVPPNYLVAFVD